MAQEETIVSGVSGRYASALFSLAQDAKASDSVAKDLDRLARMIEESADLERLVRSPAFTAEEQTRAIGAVLDKAGITGLVGNFVRLVASKRRLFALRDMIADFHRLNDSAKGVARAQVTAAEPLSDPQRAQLEDALKSITGGRSVSVAVKVDPAIIGGLVVQLGSRMYDGSLKTKLNSIRTRMKEVG